MTRDAASYEQGREDERRANTCPECRPCPECGNGPKHWNSAYCRECTLKRANDADIFFEVDIDKVCSFFDGNRVATMVFLGKVKRER